MDNEIIAVKQLPIIVEQLQQIKQEINSKVNAVLSLACTEDTYKEIKQYRSHLNKDFNELEEKRKEVKKAILTPYEEFENIYNDCVTNAFKPADKMLADRIAAVENGLKEEKRKEVQAYFNEYAQSKCIDFVTLDDAAITVSISASKKSLKDKATQFIDKVADDIAMISTLNNSAEILIEYKKIFDVSKAVIIVNNRHKLIEAERQREERLLKAQEEQKTTSAKIEINQEEEPLAAPTVIVASEAKQSIDTADETTTKTYVLSFKVKHTSIEKMKKLKNFLIEEGFEYEQL